MHFSDLFLSRDENLKSMNYSVLCNSLPAELLISHLQICILFFMKKRYSQQNLSNTYLATYHWGMIYFHRSFKICCKLVVERNVFVIWLLFIQPHFLVELFVRSANNKHMSNKTSRLHGGFNDKLLTFCKSLWLRCILQVLLASPTLRYCYQRQFVKEKTSSIYYGEVYSYAIENHIVLLQYIYIMLRNNYFGQNFL